jgi:hypothetical protein
MPVLVHYFYRNVPYAIKKVVYAMAYKGIMRESDTRKNDLSY